MAETQSRASETKPVFHDVVQLMYTNIFSCEKKGILMEQTGGNIICMISRK